MQIPILASKNDTCSETDESKVIPLAKIESKTCTVIFDAFVPYVTSSPFYNRILWSRTCTYKLSSSSFANFFVWSSKFSPWL